MRAALKPPRLDGWRIGLVDPGLDGLAVGADGFSSIPESGAGNFVPAKAMRLGVFAPLPSLLSEVF